MNNETFLSVEETAAKMMLSPATIRRLIRTRKLSAIRAGERKWKIALSAASEYMKRGESRANTADSARNTEADDAVSERTLPLEEVNKHTFTERNSEVTEEYIEAMEAGAKFPPIDVFYDGTEYWLADGLFRVKATYGAGGSDIAAYVHLGTLEDARWFRLAANRFNGLYRSYGERERAIHEALMHPRSAGMSDGQIAEYLGVTPASVETAREFLTKAKQSKRRSRREST